MSLNQSLFKNKLSDVLSKFGFHSLPKLNIQPKNPNAVPVVLATSVGIYPFNSNHVRTKTKYYYEPTINSHLINLSGAVALEMLKHKKRVIMHIEREKEKEFKKLIGLYNKRELITIVSGDLCSHDFIKSLYMWLSNIGKETPISRVDFCLYKSYSAYMEDPFVPTFLDDPLQTTKILTEQLTFFNSMALVGYDLLLNQDQEELRFLAITSLASRRPAAHLLADEIHKSVASNFLRTFAYEAPFYTGKKVFAVEIGPGMVDTGTYDLLKTRVAIVEARAMDGFPFDKKVDPYDINTWPMMHPADVGKVAALYLNAYPEEDMRKKAGGLLNLTLAGRDSTEFINDFRQSFSWQSNHVLVARNLPEFCFSPGTTWGEYPILKSGYVPVMISPPGQYF